MNIRESAVHLPENVRLSDVQVAEIRKAFSMCDRDGDGFIDSNDLRTVLRAVLQEEPSEEDVNNLLNILDDDKSGVIEFQDFLNTLAKWISESEGSGVRPKLRLGAEEERQQTHNQIKAFFSQFKKNIATERLRQLYLQSAKSKAAAGGWDSMDVDSNIMMNEEGLQRTATTPEQKGVANWGTLVEVMKAGNQAQVLEALKYFSKMLSIVEVLDSALERQAFAIIVLKIFELVAQSQLVPHFIRCLQLHFSPAIQYEALRVITYLTPGPRIPGLPVGHPFHPSQMFFKKVVVTEGVIPVYLALLSSPVQEIREQVVLAIGALASVNPEARDEVLRSNLVQAIIQQVNPVAKVTMLRKVGWVLAVLCGVTHPIQQLPAWESLWYERRQISDGFQIISCLTTLSLLLFSTDDEDVLVNVLSALQLVLPGVPQQNICERLLVLLGHHQSATVRRMTLDTITEVLKYDEKQTHMFIQLKLLNYLSELLKANDNQMRLEICESLILIILKGYGEAVMQSSIPAQLLNLLSEEALRWKIVKVFKYLTRHSPLLIRGLVRLNLVGIFCAMLANFKSFDRVLSAVYTYVGPSFNFEFVRDIFSTLQNILTIGEIEAQDEQIVNPYASLFDLPCLDKIRALLQELVGNNQQDMNAWRKASAGEAGSIEEKIMDILLKLKRAYDKMGANPTAQAASQFVMEMWKKYFEAAGHSMVNQSEKQSEPTRQLIATQNMVSLKLYHRGEVRGVDIPRNISFADLNSIIQKKFGKPVTITYKDDERENVIIDGQQALERCWATWQKQEARGEKTFNKLYIHDQTESERIAAEERILRESPLRDSPVQERPAQALSSSFPTALPNLDQFQLSSEFGEQARRLERSGLFGMLGQHSRFTREQLMQLHQRWLQLALGSGHISHDDFTQGMRFLGLPEYFIEQLWNAWVDPGKNQFPFIDFMAGLSTILRGVVEDRLKFVFWMHGQGNSFITPQDVTNLVRAVLASRGTFASAEELKNISHQVFFQFDSSRQGKLSYEDFKRAVGAMPQLQACFVNYQIQ